jgi:hypothetical protein
MCTTWQLTHYRACHTLRQIDCTSASTLWHYKAVLPDLENTAGRINGIVHVSAPVWTHISAPSPSLSQGNLHDRKNTQQASAIYPHC